MSGFLKLWKLISNIDGGIKDQLMPGFSILYIIVGISASIFESIKTTTIMPFIHSLSTSLFAIDFGIYEQVQIALLTPEKFGLMNIFVIISALTVLIFFISILEKILAFIITNQSTKGLGTALISILILGVIEFVAVLATHQKMIFPGMGFFSLLWNMPTLFNVLSTNWITFKEMLMSI
jgi:hypothetical protein